MIRFARLSGNDVCRLLCCWRQSRNRIRSMVFLVGQQAFNVEVEAETEVAP